MKSEFRVYWEDTDASGVVYHANYLKFAERARTDWLRHIGFHQSDLHEKDGVFFVVRHIGIDYKKPARLDDILTVDTKVEKLAASSLVLHQSIRCMGEELALLKVVIVCVHEASFRPIRIPDKVRKKIA